MTLPRLVAIEWLTAGTSPMATAQNASELDQRRNTTTRTATPSPTTPLTQPAAVSASPPTAASAKPVPGDLEDHDSAMKHRQTVPSDTAAGWGANVSGVLHTWGRDGVVARFTYGDGIGRYMRDLPDGSSAIPLASGELETLAAWGAMIGVEYPYDVRETPRWLRRRQPSPATEPSMQAGPAAAKKSPKWRRGRSHCL